MEIQISTNEPQPVLPHAQDVCSAGDGSARACHPARAVAPRDESGGRVCKALAVRGSSSGILSPVSSVFIGNK